MAEHFEEKKQLEPETQRLDGKVAVITGGTTGIGRATALLLSRHGVKVVIYGRHEKELMDTVRELEKIGGEFRGLTADNAYEEEIMKVFDFARREFGDIDILINNASLPAMSILDTSYDDALYVLRVNILGYLTCAREAVKSMKNKGEGHIVNIGSMSAQVRESGHDIYTATKAAIEAMSESLRKELGPQNIKVSLIEPGSVGTNIHGESADAEEQRRQEAEGQMLEAEDIAYAIYYTLTQPRRSNILEVKVAPVKQAI